MKRLMKLTLATLAIACVAAPLALEARPRSGKRTLRTRARLDPTRTEREFRREG